MFAKLFRRSAPRPAARIALRLESLDGRLLPGGLAGGVFASGGLTTASQVGHADAHHGEEISQADHGGRVDIFSIKPGQGDF